MTRKIENAQIGNLRTKKNVLCVAIRSTDLILGVFLWSISQEL